MRRGWTNLIRRPGKTVILMLLVFVLGNVISGAVSIRTAVVNTDANLRADLPAIAVLDFDHEGANAHFNRTGEWPEATVTPEMVRAVGNLPYVRMFNYSVDTQMFSPDLERAFEPFYFQEEDAWIADQFGDWDDLREQGAEFNRFNLRGLSTPEIAEVQAGLAQLVEGRLMTEAEIASGEPVALISRAFAQLNGLSVGSTVPLISGVFDTWSDEGRDFTLSMVADNLVGSREEALTIVGIFDLDLEMLDEEIWSANQQKLDLENRFFVPNAVAESSFRFQADLAFAHDPWYEGQDVSAEDRMGITAMFYLDNPAYLQAFGSEADAILPGFHTTTDLSNTFGDIAGSMETMLMISDIVLGVSVGATLVILSLLITLFLRDRKYEIGIYLALGERKGRVISQILLEVMSASIVAVSLSLFSGAMISSGISQQMLQNDLQQRQEERMMMGSWSTEATRTLAMFGTGEMSFDEMMAAYDTSMSGTAVSLFFGVATVTILVSTLAPIMYVMRLNPKKIMM